jgi:hypothetical protein
VGGDRTSDVDFLIKILPLKLKAANNTCHHAPQFSTGKVLADTSSLAM